MRLQADVNRMHQQAYDKKQPLVHLIQQLLEREGPEALEEAAIVVQIMDDCSESQASAQAQEVLRGGVMAGAAAACILQWLFDSEFLWRGLSDNTKLASLPRQ